MEYICGSEPSVQRFLELAVERSRRWSCGELYWARKHTRILENPGEIKPWHWKKWHCKKIVLEPKCLLFLAVGTIFGGQQHKIAMVSTLVGVGSLAIWIPPLFLVSFFRG